MKPLSLRILEEFQELEKERLDLHALFEVGGNEPDSREAVFDAVGELTREGLLESCGGDFYSLTEKAKRVLSARSQESISQVPKPPEPPEPPFPPPDPEPPFPGPNPTDPGLPRPIHRM